MANGIHAIFDFDGTLVDSFSSVIQKFNLLADDLSYQKVAASEIDELRNFTSRELIKYLKIPIYRLPSVILKVRKLLREAMPSLPAFNNLDAMLEELCDLKITLGILTSNSLDNVETWLRGNKLDKFFKFTHSESNFFGKKFVLNKVIKSYQLDRSKTFYIGDETRDIDAAKDSGISSIAVTWGFNSEKIISQNRPDFIVHEPRDISLLFKEMLKTQANL